MCAVCVQWELGRMTPAEVERALLELTYESSTDDELYHALEVLEKTKEKK
jgi:hypothetical protein